MEKFWQEHRAVKALALSSLSSVLLFMAGYVFYRDSYFWFLNWNLFLAWIPLIFVWLLVQHLRKSPWLSLQGIFYSVLWLAFLPNSFYLVSDFVHIHVGTSETAPFYVAMIMSFAVNGFVLGYTSLYMIHKQLLKRFTALTAHSLAAIALLLCSFAIYLGRYSRWNTWDVVVNPVGLIFDVSDRFVNPIAHGQTFRITLLFFILLASVYTLIWQFIQVIRLSKDKD